MLFAFTGSARLLEGAVLPKSWILSKLLGFFTLMIWIWISPTNPWIFPILLEAISFELLACKLGEKIALEILY